jgi:hypothetical protein
LELQKVGLLKQIKTSYNIQTLFNLKTNRTNILLQKNYKNMVDKVPKQTYLLKQVRRYFTPLNNV